MRISFFEILVNFDVIFKERTNENLTTTKTGKNNSRRLFEYQIRFSLPLLVPEIYAAEETSLVSDFCTLFLYNWPT